MPGAGLLRLTLDRLVIDDEASFRHVGLYGELKDVLVRDRYPFHVLPPGPSATWDRALFLNLTFFAGEGDVLYDRHIAADVVAHAAWHHLARKAFPDPATAEALLFGEAIASAFDLYLVGRLLGHSPDSTFLETQVPRMAEAAAAAGVDEAAFEAMLADIAERPEAAFETVRRLLFDATTGLSSARSVEEAASVLAELDERRPISALLHHYELSNWILFARAHGAPGPDARVRDVDAALRSAADSLAWLEERWLPKR